MISWDWNICSRSRWQVGLSGSLNKDLLNRRIVPGCGNETAMSAVLVNGHLGIGMTDRASEPSGETRRN